MKIGIIGKGRMGFSLLQYCFEFDCSLVLICRNPDDAEKIHQKMEKALLKQKKRGLITEEVYEEKLKSFLISTSYQDLHDCDLVIESVIEDLAVKQAIFSTVEQIVSETCMLATNTSSLKLDEVFSLCERKERCIGLHFFNPVKYTKHVELGLLEETFAEYEEKALRMMEQIEMVPLVATGEGCLVMTKIINTIVTFFYLIYQEKNIEIQELNELIRNEVMMFGPADIVDTTGLYIILECLKNFQSKRYDGLYQNFFDKVQDAYENGYVGGTSKKGLLDYEAAHLEPRNQLSEETFEQYKKNCVIRFQAVLLNEVAYLKNAKIIVDEKLVKTVEEILGLRSTLAKMLATIGEDKVKYVLEEDYQRYQITLFQAEDFGCLK